MKTTVITIIIATATANAAMAQNDTTAIETQKDDKVQVAFKEVEEKDILGGIEVLDYKALTEKNYNTGAIDNLQGYVSGFNGNSNWATGEYLLIIDGVPRDAGSVLATEIEKVTFLKSAAAVTLYGSRAAKGAILITTKKGQIGSLRINARANVGLNTAVSYPKYLSSAEYMTLYNEARVNDGMEPLYSDEQIYNSSTGNNPYRYPNVDFYSKDYIRNHYWNGNANIDIQGGGKFAKYYVNLNYNRANDVFKQGEAKDNYSDRLAFRGNVDITINDWISAFVHSNVMFYNSRGANSSHGSYWEAAATMRPNRVSPYIPLSYTTTADESSQTMVNNSMFLVEGQYFLGGTQIDQGNVFADYFAAGNSKYSSRMFQGDVGIKLNFDKFVKGLSFQTQFAMDYNTAYTTYYSNTYAVYEPTWASYNGQDVIVSLTKYNLDKKSGVQNIGGSYNQQTLMLNAQLNYDRHFGKDHHFSAMLLGHGWQRSQAGEYHHTTNLNLGLELAYDFADTYFIQADAALAHSAKLAKGHRVGFSPSLTLGWKMKNTLFKDVKAIDYLTLSGSLSKLCTDIDIDGYYLYTSNYTQANGAWWGWRDGVATTSTQSKRGDNEDLTYIKRKEFALTLKGGFLNRMIEFNTSFFYDIFDGGVIVATTQYPDYLILGYPESSFLPYINYNKDRRSGFDFGVKFNKEIGKVGLSLGVNGTYYTTKALKRDENYADEYQNREGRPLDAIFGLVSDGFYESEEDIANSPTNLLGDVKPGDIKYVDQNSDGVIDSKDEVYLGKGGWYGSPFTLGINLTAKWNNFTFFALMTGNYGAKTLKSSSYYWVYGDGKYSEVVRDRWTTATAKTATYPRLTTLSGDNNFRTSDFWLCSANRFDLAKVQLTYDFPKQLFRGKVVRGLQVYLSGSNLLTVAKERKFLQMSVGSAPQYRNFNLGAIVNL